jgi:hypothetical protein
MNLRAESCVYSFVRNEAGECIQVDVPSQEVVMQALGEVYVDRESEANCKNSCDALLVARISWKLKMIGPQDLSDM